MRKQCSMSRVWAMAGLALAGLGVAQRAAAATPDITGLTPTLHVSFDANTVANDNGTGTITPTNEGTPTYVASPNGKAINTAIFTPYANLGDVFFANTDFTLSAYATLGANPNGIMVHARDNVGGSTGGLVLRRGTTNEVVLTLGVSAASKILSVSNIPGGDVVYHHYAVVANSGGITLYVDGAPRASTTSNTIAVAKTALQFGSRHGGVLAGEAKFGGKIDDFRVYSEALSPAKVTDLWTSLVTSGADAGVISIRTGVRDSSAAGGNVWMFPSSQLGPVPTLAGTWNKTPDWNNNNAGFFGVITNLMNSAESLTFAKLYYTFRNTYISAAATTTPNGALTKSYFDDGTAASYSLNEGGVTTVTLPDPGVTRGWEVMLTGVPYTFADLYVVIASDQTQANFKACPILVKVGDGAWTSYYGLPGLERTLVGGQNWAGSIFSSGEVKEGNHYVKIPLNNLTPGTSIAIAHGARNTGIYQRIGLAGLQLVRRSSAFNTTDPYYVRTVTGSASWGAAAWDNAGTTLNSWLDSTDVWKTAAILSASGGTTLTLPEAGATAEAVSVRGSGSFTLSGTGALTLNGASQIDAYGMAAADVVTISAPVVASNMILSANNAGAAGVGCTRLSSAGNSVTSLTVTKGTLAADSVLPASAALALNGGALMFTASGTVVNPVQVTGDSIIRVWSGQTGEVSGPLSGTASLTKSDTGNLTLSGGGSLGNLLWNNTGTIRLAGTAPFALSNVSGGNASAVTLELIAPTTLSGSLWLGGTTLSLAPGAAVTANAVRWCEGGTFNTTVNQTGGRLTVLGNNNTVSTSASALFAHWSSTCNYALSGGDFLATNAVAMLAWDGTTTWTVSGSGRAYVKGVNMRGSTKVGMATTLNLDGGTLEVGSNGIFTSGTGSSRAINLYTGTLRALDSFTVAANTVSTAVSLKNSAAGVTLDLNGKTVTWSAPLADVGKLVVSDATVTPGKLRLLGASTHSGGVTHQAGTLEVGQATALGTGPLDWSGGTLDLAATDAACGALSVTNTVTLKVRVGMEADLSGSGSLTASSVALNNDVADTVAVVLDLNGIDTPLNAYPVLLCASLPPAVTDRMTVSFVNGGAGLLETAAVALEQRADGVYAVFSGTVAPKNLFWREGVALGNWSVYETDAPWGVGAIDGDESFYTGIDTVNFTDTDQPSVTVTVFGVQRPVAMNLNNASTAFTFNEDVGGGSLEVPSLGFTKSGAGTATFNMPVAISNATLAVDAGTLRVNAALGSVPTATISSPVTVAAEAALTFGGSGVQTIDGTLTGAGAVRADGGRVRIAGVSGSWASLAGELVAGAGGTLEITNALVGVNAPTRLVVEAGGTMEFTTLDASGYTVTNTNPIEVAGTLKLLQRDSTARGVKLYDGAAILLNGTNMHSGHAMDLFDRPRIALVSGTASIAALDPQIAAEARITVRTEHSPKTFDVQHADAVLTVAVPLINGAPGIVLDKVGPGLLRFTAASTTTSKLLVSAGAVEIGGAGSLGAGASVQPLEILAGATFRYASSADQTLSGAITCAGTFVKAGSGKLSVTGSFAVVTGGVLAVPAAATAGEAVRADALTLDGELQVTNVESLQEGRGYTLLTSLNAMQADIASRVTGLPESWRIELIDDGKTLVAYKPQGTLIRLQ